MQDFDEKLGENVLPKDGRVFLRQKFFEPMAAADYFQKLQQEIHWSQEPIVIFGKRVMQPRLTAWYGDPEAIYSYSRISMRPVPWTETLREIRERVELATGAKFNSVLMNQYRTGQDGMGWHRDNEKELGTDPTIASVSFGVTRAFKLRHRQDKGLNLSIDLEPCSLLVMSGETQTHWEHAIPKRTRIQDARINLTFRLIR